MTRVSRSIRQFAAGERGAITVLNIFLSVTMLMLAGGAVDMAQLISARSQLQNAADTAAHAALYLRDTKSAADAKTGAVSLVESEMPTVAYGDVLKASDIHFGTWDPATRKFTVDETSKDGVLVTVGRDSSHGNRVASYLLKFAGVDWFNVVSQSVFVTYTRQCMREGFVADGIVDIQSNNAYYNGICLHSNAHVEVNSGNYFEDGTIVSMPDTSQIGLPSSGFSTNPGLQQALRDEAWRLRIVDKLPTIIDNMLTWGNEYQQSYIKVVTPLPAPYKTVTPADILPNTMYYFNCSQANGNFTFSAGTYSNFVLRTNCKIKFANGVVLEDALVATTNTDPKSVNGPQGVQIGKDDNCAPGGGAQVLTLGGVDVAANLAMFGGQIIATGDIGFSARADGMQGVSMISGSTISGTSNMSMALCGTGMENDLEAKYFRMAF